MLSVTFVFDEFLFSVKCQISFSVKCIRYILFIHFIFSFFIEITKMIKNKTKWTLEVQDEFTKVIY